TVGELLILLARATSLPATTAPPSLERTEQVQLALHWNTLAERCYSPEESPRALWSQRAALTALLGRTTEAQELAAQAVEHPWQTATDRYLVAAEHLAQGRIRQALPLLQEATEQDPQNFWVWFLRGLCHDHQAQDAEAAAC